MDMRDIRFEDGSFDLIWSEGSIYFIGFENGLKQWKKLLRPGGFMGLHDACWLKPNPPKEVVDFWLKEYPGIADVPTDLRVVERCGYNVIGYCTLPEDAWLIEYYEPLEKRIFELREKYRGEEAIQSELDMHQHEIDMFRKHKEWYGSVFFIIQRRD